MEKINWNNLKELRDKFFHNNPRTTTTNCRVPELDIKIITDEFAKRCDSSLDGFIRFLISFYSKCEKKNLSNKYPSIKSFDRTDEFDKYLEHKQISFEELKHYKKEILRCCIDFDNPLHTAPDYSNCLSLKIMEFCIKQLDSYISKGSNVRIPFCTIPSYALFNVANYKYAPSYIDKSRYQEIGEIISHQMGIDNPNNRLFGNSDIKYDATILISPTIYGEKLENGKTVANIIKEELERYDLSASEFTLFVILPYKWLESEECKTLDLRLLKKVVSLPCQVKGNPIAWLCFQKNREMAPTYLYNASHCKKNGDVDVERLMIEVGNIANIGHQRKEDESLAPGTNLSISIEQFTKNVTKSVPYERNTQIPTIALHNLFDTYAECSIDTNAVIQQTPLTDNLYKLESDSYVVVKSKATGNVRIGYISPDNDKDIYCAENNLVNFKINQDERIQRDYLLSFIFSVLKNADNIAAAFDAISFDELPTNEEQLKVVINKERSDKKESDKQYEAKIREEYEKYKTDVKTKKHNLAQYIAKIVPAIGTMDCLLETLKIEDDNIKETMRSLRYYSDLVSASIDGFNDFEEIGTIMEFNLHDVVDDFIKVRGYDYIEKSWEYESEECISKRIRFSKSTLNNILSNIYQNVVDHAGFSQTDENKGKICCSLSLIENKLVLEIKNNGKPIEGSLGFSPDSKTTESIFTEGTTTKTDKDGHGIGCYYMKKCLEHKDEKGNPYGSIDIVSTPNEVFKVKYVITFNQVK